MNLSDRILVMYEGEIVGEFDPKKASVEELGLYMAGAKRQDTGGREMNEEKTSFWKKDRRAARSSASLLSILIGLLAGTLLILIVGCTNKSLGFQSAWEGIRLVFVGLFSTGRDATGALTFGFNPANMGNMLFRAMPLILTGLSVAMAFKTGLFNIGAPGQYLAGTCATLFIALSIPSEHGFPRDHLAAGLPRRHGWRARSGVRSPACSKRC